MKPSALKLPILLLLLCALLSTILTACTPVATGRQSQLLQQAARIKGREFIMSPAELRFQLNDLAGTFAGTIEDTADLIIASASDPVTRRRALLWKTNAIPEGFRALFHKDPAIALLDFWSFSVQMTNFFSNNPDISRLGPFNALAYNTSNSIVDQTRKLATKITADGDVSFVEDRILEWAEKNPINSITFSRQSVIPYLYTIAGERIRGAFETVGNLSTDLEDLTFQMAVYAELLPRQARWQAELMVDRVMETENLRSGINAIAEITSLMERITVVIEQLTDEIASERKIVISSLRKERLETIEALDSIRIQSQRYLTAEVDDGIAELKSERSLVTELLKEERMAVMQAISDQIKIVLDDIDRQRKVSLIEIEASGQRITSDAIEQSEELIDHFFWRALQLSILLLLGVLLIGALLWKLKQRNSRIATESHRNTQKENK